MRFSQIPSLAACLGMLISPGGGAQTVSPGTNSVPVIVTAAPVYDALAALRGGERFPEGAHLLKLEHGKETPLLPNFAVSADAAVSSDATRVLFAGKKAAVDHWSIWELQLSGGTLRRVVATPADTIRPLYLPDDQLVYAIHTAQGFEIESASLHGGQRKRITFLQASAIPADVLADGRVLFESGYPLGSQLQQGARPEIYLVYPDGSGVESYRCDHGTSRWGGRQVASGDVVFTQGHRLARFTSAVAHQVPIVAPAAEYSGAIAETADGAWLVSARRSAAARYALSIWHPGDAVLRNVLVRPGENLIEPVVVEPRTPARAHPVALHPWDYGNLLVLDARLSREGDLKFLPAKLRVEAEDDAGGAVVLGDAPVAGDGSAFIQAPGDRPIRFALLDGSGKVLRQDHGWFWIAKGEQRICVGCHTGPERAPENKVPEVLLHNTTPVNMTHVPAHDSPAQGGR